MRYPDYVKQFKPKGMIVKKVNGTYYAYYATSKRVPDKKYPVQIIKGLAGRIDESGFHKLSKASVDTGHVVARECGFTNFLLKFEDGYISRRNGRVKERRNLYRSMIVYLSNNFYLNDDPETTVYSVSEMAEKFQIGIPNQITAISRICGYGLNGLEPLKYICSVTMGHRRFESELTDAQKKLLERIGITENEIRQGFNGNIGGGAGSKGCEGGKIPLLPAASDVCLRGFGRAQRGSGNSILCRIKF